MYKKIAQQGHARRGEYTTPHGTVQTPVFMNVGTQAAIKGGLSARDLREINCQVELSNTYHLHVRPGDKLIKEMGGLAAMKERNEKKAKILYDFLDESKLFKGTVEKKDRSLMNVPFVTGDADMDAKFVKEAKEAGFENLKGHRSVGGMRASIYNAMPIEGVEALVAFMKKFEEANL